METHPFPPSNRFLSVQELIRSRRRSGLSLGASGVFPDGHWQIIRAGLECQGWNGRQIEMVHDQLRQGWPLAMAKRNVAMRSGCCPIGLRRDG